MGPQATERRCRSAPAGTTPRHEGSVIARRNSQSRGGGSTYRINDQIRVSEVRVIDPDGDQLGIMSPDEGRERAEELGLDLVEVAPDARPPVCKIMDYGKFRYQQSKKKKKASDNVALKTLRIRPKTESHDLNTKLSRAEQFLDKGNQVRFVMQMRGRERQFTDRWIEQLGEIIEQLREQCDRDIKVVNPPEGQGWQITALVEPA